MRIAAPPREPAVENTVPLINIVFLLLVFFLLAGTLAPRPPFRMQPVESAELPPADLPRDMLYVAADGRLFLSGRSLTLPDLARAPGLGGKSPDAPQEVLLDKRLQAKALFPVIEALSKAGVTKVRLITQRSEAP